MFENFTKDQLIDALDELIALEIVSGTVLVGTTVVSDMLGDAVNDPPAIEYDDNGFSDHNDKGGVMIEDVEAHRRKMEAGNEYEQRVALNTAQHYCFIIPGREYGPGVLRQLWANMGRDFATAIVSGGGVMISQFRDMNEPYMNKETGELSWTKTNDMHFLKGEDGGSLWVRNPEVNGDVVPNHRTLSRGHFGRPTDPDWLEEFAQELAPKIIRRMKHSAKWAKKNAERGGKAPSVGPRR